KLDLTDSDSEESEAAICDPSPCTKNQEPDESSEDSIDGSGEGTSQGMAGNMSPVEKLSATVRECRRPRLTGELPGTSAGKRSTASPTEKPSDTPDAFHENETEKDHPQRNQKRPWSPAEIAAVMRHFRKHIDTGKLASFLEIEQCQKAEHPALQSRSLQNIRDFVRNRGITKKKKQQRKQN
ncbi:hypothetical protein XENORESO_015618, partial [Xenotaenia resolanae]